MLDRDLLNDAILDADLVVLLASIAHITGDGALLDRYDVNAFDHGRGAATLSPAVGDEIRARALDVLSPADLDQQLTGAPISEDLVHPVVFTHDVQGNLTATQLTTFGICLAGMLALAGSLYVNELTGKRVDARLRELRETLQ